MYMSFDMYTPEMPVAAVRQAAQLAQLKTSNNLARNRKETSNNTANLIILNGSDMTTRNVKIKYLYVLG